MVPLGPRLVFITSWIPLAAEMFTANAWAALATSAFGFNKLIAIVFGLFSGKLRLNNRDYPNSTLNDCKMAEVCFGRLTFFNCQMSPG